MSDLPQHTSHRPLQMSARDRFYGGYTWLVLKNLIGWTLILLALVAGPFVPGPGGIPLFLIGFALVSFPGKRKLTARVFRGRRISWRARSVRLFILAAALILPALALWLLRPQLEWLRSTTQGPAAIIAAYLAGVVTFGLASAGAVLFANLLLRIMPPIRRRVRPWLRRHRIRLLPPRYRHRFSHEKGTGPIRLKGEIISFLKRRHASNIESDNP